MVRRILPVLSVGVMVLGGILLAHGADKDDKDDRDERGNKKGHRAILNAVTGGNAQHGQLSNEITALSGAHQGILDAVNGGTNSSNTAHGTQDTAHGTLQTEHATQNTAHTTLSDKIDALQADVDALSGGGGEGNHTLRWDTNNPTASRFAVLAAFNDEAVLDKNTGLVWEQAPLTFTRTWAGAVGHCLGKNVGGTRGWRLPSVAELASLIDPSLPEPFVPASVFTGVQSASYWSAASLADAPAFAWSVIFVGGFADPDDKDFTYFVWCVRGPTQESAY